MQTGPHPARGREAGRRQPEPEGKGAISVPETTSSTKLWSGSQLLIKSSWDSGWLASARRVTARDQLPRRDTWHTWDKSPAAHPGNWAAGMKELIRCITHLVRVLSPKHLVAWATRNLEGRKHRPNHVCAFGEYPRTWTWGLRPGKCMQPRTHFRQFPCRAT